MSSPPFRPARTLSPQEGADLGTVLSFEVAHLRARWRQRRWAIVILAVGVVVAWFGRHQLVLLGGSAVWAAIALAVLLLGLRRHRGYRSRGVAAVFEEPERVTHVWYDERIRLLRWRVEGLVRVRTARGDRAQWTVAQQSVAAGQLVDALTRWCPNAQVAVPASWVVGPGAAPTARAIIRRAPEMPRASVRV